MPKSHIKRIAILTITLGLLFSLSLIHVWSRLRIIKLGYEISERMMARRKLVDLNGKLRLQAAALKAPGRIEYIAKKRFGLKAPRPEQIILMYTPEK